MTKKGLSMKHGCDAMLRNRKTGEIRRCGDSPTVPVGTRRIPRSKREWLKRGGQPRHFCKPHAKVMAKKEVSITDGKPRRGRTGL